MASTLAFLEYITENGSKIIIFKIQKNTHEVLSNFLPGLKNFPVNR